MSQVNWMRRRLRASRRSTFTFLFILVSALILPTAAIAAKLPENCAQVRQQNPAAGDGEYTLNLQGHYAKIYCADMAGTPKEYISLARTGPTLNYSFVPGAHKVYYSRSYVIQGQDAHTAYRKLRIDPVTLVVDQKDTTFVDIVSEGANGYDPENPDFNPTPKTAVYANASDCYDLWSSRGQANVDLQGIDWVIDPSVVFQVGGWAQAGTIAMNPDRKVLNMTGGGWCGGAGPVGPLKLKPTGPLVPIDDTPPAILPTVTGTQGQNGWYTSDVNVSWSVSDSESAVSSKTGCDPTTVSADTAGVNFTCTAASDGGQSSNTVSIKRDATAPATTATAPATWQKTDVTVSLNATDNLSGVAATHYTVDGGSEQTGTSLTISGEGTHPVTYRSVDQAGNAEAANTVTVLIDKTLPTISAAADRAANVAGWYNAAVTVSFHCDDALSGVASCTAPVTLSGEGAQQSATGTAVDKAGNADSASVGGINIDTTAPTTTVSATQPNANGWNKTDVSLTLAATDNLSGVARTEYNLDGAGWVAYNAAVPITAEGTHTLLFRSVDQADNVEAAQTLTVRVDKTAPEAYLQFDAASRDLQLIGRDALSGAATAGPITPVSVAPARKGWDKDERDHKDRDEVERDAEVRTYLVKDNADNTLQLVVAVKKDGREIKGRVISLQYNEGAVIGELKDRLAVEWSADKNGTLKRLEQQFSVREGRTGQSVMAGYNASKNVTSVISVTTGGGHHDDDRKGERDDRPSKVTLPGMVLLRMTTSGGHLSIEVPGL